jgi:UDP-2,4-diacetamido-2,4,6-trideoxy-beta-L-altropyranose hydrolase
MRCLALAEAVRPEAADIQFVCRELEGELHDLIEAKGFRCSLLPAAGTALDPISDARQTAALSEALDWLVVDHYEIDQRWERTMRPECKRLMVIDDLVDRAHDCDVLLDQTYGRRADEYEALTPDDCRVLAGTQYALLRPEFAAHRPAALARRAASEGIGRVLVSMGGFDPENRTLDVLETLATTSCASRLTVTVVRGARTPDSDESLRSFASHFEKLDIRQRVDNMAELMAASDIAIGAGGTTSWERCCMGLPALVCIMADNQRDVARQLEAAGAISVWESRSELKEQLDMYEGDHALYRSASAAAADVCDGLGLERVVAEMQSC